MHCEHVKLIHDTLFSTTFIMGKSESMNTCNIDKHTIKDADIGVLCIIFEYLKLVHDNDQNGMVTICATSTGTMKTDYLRIRRNISF